MCAKAKAGRRIDRLPRAIMMVTPRAMPEAMAGTPGVVSMVRIIVERIGARLTIDAFLNVHPRRYIVVVVVMLHDPGRFFAYDFPFKVLPFAVSRAVKVCSERRRGEQERQCSKSNAFHGDEILGLPGVK
jgi:hypothetical protein